MEIHFLSNEKKLELEKFMNTKGFTAVEKLAADHVYKHNSFVVAS